jgi:hypothetical protein
VRRGIGLIAACAWLVMSAGASDAHPPIAAAAPAPAIIDLDFGHISGSTVPDGSGNANDGVGKKGAVGLETSWSPGTRTDSQGTIAVIFAGRQKERIEVSNRAGDTFTGTRVIPSNTPMWAIATYDGAHLRTYVARGNGTNLALDRSVAQTGILNTGATITGVDENLVVGAKHRKGHSPGGSGTSEDAEAFFNGTMSRFLAYDTALTQSEIAAVVSGSALSATPDAVRGPERDRSGA